MCTQVREAQDAGRAEAAKLRLEFESAASSMFSKEAYRALERQLAKALAEARRLTREARGDGEEGSAVAHWKAQAAEAMRKLEAAEAKLPPLRSAVARRDALVAELRAKLDAADAGLRAQFLSETQMPSADKERLRSLQAAVARKDALVAGLRRKADDTAAQAQAQAAEGEAAAATTKRLRGELRARDEALRELGLDAERARGDAARAAETAEAAVRSEQRAWETAGEPPPPPPPLRSPPPSPTVPPTVSLSLRRPTLCLVSGADAAAMRDRAAALLDALHAAVARSLRTALSLQHVAAAAAAASAAAATAPTTRGTGRRRRERARERAAAANDPEAIAQVVELEAEEVCDILAATLSEFSLAAHGPALVQLGAALTAAFGRAREALFSCTHRAPRSSAGSTPAAAGLSALRDALAEVASRVQAEAARAEALAAAQALHVPSLDGWLGGFERAAPAGGVRAEEGGGGGSSSASRAGEAGPWTAARTKTIVELERELEVAAEKLNEVGRRARLADLAEEAAPPAGVV